MKRAIPFFVYLTFILFSYGDGDDQPSIIEDSIGISDNNRTSQEDINPIVESISGENQLISFNLTTEWNTISVNSNGIIIGANLTVFLPQSTELTNLIPVF